jgi:hypothetical protein
MQTDDMTNGVKATMCTPLTYRVCVQGVIPLVMADRLCGMQITRTGVAGDERSTIIGSLPDQAALAGVLNTLYEMHYPVLSVECLDIG